MVVGVPCDQFANQEPGDADEIAEFCAAEYKVTFPLTEKLPVNGRHRHPLFELLTELPDEAGMAGDVEWNFEKFLVSPRGEPVARFRPTTLPEDVELTRALEAQLPEVFPPVWSTRPVQDVRVGDRVISAERDRAHRHADRGALPRPRRPALPDRGQPRRAGSPSPYS